MPQVIVGGAAGTLADAVPGTVAVEPWPDVHRALLTNALANGCDNVRAVEASVANEPCRLDFYLERSTNLGGTSAVRPRSVESQFTADAAPLPDLVTSEGLASARLLKIDVEGARQPRYTVSCLRSPSCGTTSRS